MIDKIKIGLFNCLICFRNLSNCCELTLFYLFFFMKNIRNIHSFMFWLIVLSIDASLFLHQNQFYSGAPINLFT